MSGSKRHPASDPAADAATNPLASEVKAVVITCLVRVGSRASEGYST